MAETQVNPAAVGGVTELMDHLLEAQPGTSERRADAKRCPERGTDEVRREAGLMAGARTATHLPVQGRAAITARDPKRPPNDPAHAVEAEREPAQIPDQPERRSVVDSHALRRLRADQLGKPEVHG